MLGERNRKSLAFILEPIFVTGVLNIASLKEKQNQLIDTDLFILATLRSGYIIKIIPKEYKEIRENFITKNISLYTYHLKSERAYRVSSLTWAARIRRYLRNVKKSGSHWTSSET